MASRGAVERFVAQKTLAMVGVSRSGRKFGNHAVRALRENGYTVHVVHPDATTLEGAPCYASIEALPEEVSALLVVVPPARAEAVVAQAADAGIAQVWLQQGSESEAAISLCKQRGMEVVSGECILMFAEKVRFPHSWHRWFNKVAGRLPKDEG